MIDGVITSIKTISERLSLDFSNIISLIKCGLLPELSENAPLTENETDAFVYASRDHKIDLSSVSSFISTYQLFSNSGASTTQIETVKQYLIDIGCNEKRIIKLFIENPEAYILSIETVTIYVKRLEFWGFSKEQTASVLTDVLLIPVGYMDGRIEVVLDYLEADDPSDNIEQINYIISNPFLFYRHYTDPEEAIWRISKRFGKKKAFIILREHPEILYLWKEGEYKDDPGFKNQMQELCDILRKYII